MKSEIHPQYFPEAKATCACGAVHVVGSTKPELRVEICSNCHPFYTGGDKVIDTAGRVERFKQKQARFASATASRAESRRAKQVKTSVKKASVKTPAKRQ